MYLINDYFFSPLLCSQLHLGQNSIKYLGPNLFAGLIGISHLNLSNNEIQAIHPDALESAQIAELDLSNNPVGRWDPNVFNHAG